MLYRTRILFISGSIRYKTHRIIYPSYYEIFVCETMIDKKKGSQRLLVHREVDKIANNDFHLLKNKTEIRLSRLYPPKVTFYEKYLLYIYIYMLWGFQRFITKEHIAVSRIYHCGGGGGECRAFPLCCVHPDFGNLSTPPMG